MSLKRILISQNQPSNMAAFESLKAKFGVEIDFFPFFKIETLTSREFRAQRINLSEYTAVVFSSRATIDAYFTLCEDARFKVPETMKYFCTSELVATYLQKHIVFRKRKIFSGDGTPASILKLITSKHSGEKFLITTSESANVAALAKLFEDDKLDFTVAEMVKSVPQDLTSTNIKSYDMLVLYNRFDVESLFASYPDFKQDDLKIAAYGKSVVKSIEDAGLSIALQAPTPEAPSVSAALELYLSKNQ